jgi:hypothetical protein
VIPPPPTPRTARGARLRAAAAALALAATGARADPAPLPVHLAAVNGHVQAALDLSAVFGAEREHAFGNGLTNVVEIYTSLVPRDGRTPAAIYGRIVEILFDVWEETYTVTIKDPEHPRGWHKVLPTFAALRAFLADAREVDLGPMAALPDQGFVIEARVEVNPISREQLQRTREYIAAASGTRPTGSRSVLGAMASFLLREPDAGSDVHVLRSTPLTRAGVATR